MMLTHIPITRDDLETLSNRMNVTQDPPAGLIIHTAYEGPQGVNVIDVWESEEAFRQFQETRLGPAMGAFMHERGVQAPAGIPETNIHEVFDVVRGA